MSVGPRVLVAGGSLGGLTAAHVLGDLGCDVTVLERSPEPLTGRGAGIVLHPATVRWWRERDVRPLAEMSAAMRRLRYLDAGGTVADEQPCRYRVSSFDALYRDLSARRSSVRGIGAGRRWAATVLMAESSSVREQTNEWFDP